MYCRKCGALLNEGVGFCTLCGTEVVTVTSESLVGNTEKEKNDISTQINVIEKDDTDRGVIENDASINTEVSFDTDQKPLYGYEQYDQEKYEYLKEQEDKQIQPQPQVDPFVTQQAVQVTDGYIPPEYSSYTVQNPYMGYVSPTQQYIDKKEKKPKGNRIGLLIIILSIMFIAIFICLMVAIGILKDIRNTVYYNYYDNEGYNYYQNEDDLSYEEGDISNRHSAYEWLINDYFLIIGRGDKDAISELLHPIVIEALKENGYQQSEFADAIDAFVEYYGVFVEEYSIVEVYPYNTSDYAALAEKIGFDQAELEAYVDVYVGATIRKEKNSEKLWFDFDLIRVDGNWYLVSVW